MAKFHFKLQGLLRQREHVEAQRQRVLASVRQEMNPLQFELQRVNESMKGTTANLKTSHLTGRLDMNLVAAHRRFMLAMRQKATALAHQIAAVQKRADVAQAALAEAVKERKVTEKLREHNFEQWKADGHRKATTESDETAMLMGRRNSLDEESRDGT